MKTLNRAKNQKTQETEESGFYIKKIRNLSLKNINPEDLQRLSTLKILYAQAVNAKWLRASEANFQNFVAAAVRANRAEGNSVKIFVTIVRKALWHHITQAQEDRARDVIAKDRNSRATTNSKQVHVASEFATMIQRTVSSVSC